MSLRLVGGRWRGRVLLGGAPRGSRPSASRVREAVASMLEARGALGGAVVLDLFAGSGALSFEALSRGARRAVLVDVCVDAVRSIRSSAAALDARSAVTVLRLDLLATDVGRVASALTATGPAQFDLVFADPPYAQSQEGLAVVGGLVRFGAIARDAHIVLEVPSAVRFELPAELSEVRSYRFGDTGIILATTKEAGA